MKILTIGDLNAVRERAAKILLPREESNRSADGKCCGLDTGTGHMQILICGGTGCKASSSHLIYEKIRELLARQMEISPELISMETDIVNDLGADSLDVVELVMSVEETFNLLIGEEDAAGLFTVQQIVEYIEKRI